MKAVDSVFCGLFRVSVTSFLEGHNIDLATAIARHNDVFGLFFFYVIRAEKIRCDQTERESFNDFSEQKCMISTCFRLSNFRICCFSFLLRDIDLNLFGALTTLNWKKLTMHGSQFFWQLQNQMINLQTNQIQIFKAVSTRKHKSHF